MPLGVENEVHGLCGDVGSSDPTKAHKSGQCERSFGIGHSVRAEGERHCLRTEQSLFRCVCGLIVYVVCPYGIGERREMTEVFGQPKTEEIEPRISENQETDGRDTNEIRPPTYRFEPSSR